MLTRGVAFRQISAQFAALSTTCTALAIVNSHLHSAHIGDSRLYLLRPGTTSGLTRDPSCVGRLVETGMVRPEDAESHPLRHILTAALGPGRGGDSLNSRTARSA